MKSSMQEIFPLIGTSMDGGSYAGRIMIDGQAFALIVAPKAEGEHADIAWNKSTKLVEGATSYFDGLANTKAMSAAGSKLAQWALDLRCGGHDDWYIPAQDELEILYRYLKPTTYANTCWGRSGINLSAIAPTRPYVPDFPTRTEALAFQEGGSEAFDAVWYWSSTQSASDGAYAWGQIFDGGHQHNGRKLLQLRARAVRRSSI